jgi:hypothetical protein
MAGGLASGKDQYNVTFSVGWAGCYRPGSWVPVEIEIVADVAEPFGGILKVTASQDDLVRLNVAQQIVVADQVPLHVPLVTKLSFGADKCSLSISDAKNRPRWSFDYDLWNYGGGGLGTSAVRSADCLVGVIGARDQWMRTLENTGRSVRRNAQDDGRVYVRQKLPRMVPWDWAGFDCLDALVLNDLDWDQLNEHQCQAICQWVSGGGKLLVVMGGHPLPADNALARWLPFAVGGREQVTLTPKDMSDLGLPSPSDCAASCWTVTPREGARVLSRRETADGRLVELEAEAGFGRVRILAFDPSEVARRQGFNDDAFWAGRLDSTIFGQVGRDFEGISLSPGQADTGNQWTYYDMSGETLALNSVLGSLLSVKELRPLSIWWVVLMLGALGVLLGPVDYLVLKRIDRQPLTWITSAGCIAVFTFGAYYGVRALRAGNAQLRMVSVVDAIDGEDSARSTVYAGLFAPKSDDYAIEGLAKSQWWSGLSPQQGYFYRGHDEASTDIVCLQHDGGNLPVSLPIGLWSMRCLLCEAPAEGVPFSAEVAFDGNDAVLEITNTSRTPISGGCVYVKNDRGFRFGSVPPGQTVTVRRACGPLALYYQPSGDEIQYPDVSGGGLVSVSDGCGPAQFATGCAARTRAMQAAMNGGAAVVTARYDGAPSPFAVAGHECEMEHSMLARLVVFPANASHDAVSDEEF